MLHQVFAICLLVGAALSADMTRVPNSNGADVVEAVVNIIRESCLFADDKRFLRRLAYVESEDGMSPNTYRQGYHGGIWQVNYFSNTVKPVLSNHSKLDQTKILNEKK